MQFQLFGLVIASTIVFSSAMRTKTGNSPTKADHSEVSTTNANKGEDLMSDKLSSSSRNQLKNESSIKIKLKSDQKEAAAAESASPSLVVPSISSHRKVTVLPQHGKDVRIAMQKQRSISADSIPLPIGEKIVGASDERNSDLKSAKSADGKLITSITAEHFHQAKGVKLESDAKQLSEHSKHEKGPTSQRHSGHKDPPSPISGQKKTKSDVLIGTENHSKAPVKQIAEVEHDRELWKVTVSLTEASRLACAFVDDAMLYGELINGSLNHEPFEQIEAHFSSAVQISENKAAKKDKNHLQLADTILQHFSRSLPAFNNQNKNGNNDSENIVFERFTQIADYLLSLMDIDVYWAESSGKNGNESNRAMHFRAFQIYNNHGMTLNGHSETEESAKLNAWLCARPKGGLLSLEHRFKKGRGEAKKLDRTKCFAASDPFEQNAEGSPPCKDKFVPEIEQIPLFDSSDGSSSVESEKDENENEHMKVMKHKHRNFGIKKHLHRPHVVVGKTMVRMSNAIPGINKLKPHLRGMLWKTGSDTKKGRLLSLSPPGKESSPINSPEKESSPINSPGKESSPTNSPGKKSSPTNSPTDKKPENALFESGKCQTSDTEEGTGTSKTDDEISANERQLRDRLILLCVYAFGEAMAKAFIVNISLISMHAKAHFWHRRSPYLHCGIRMDSFGQNFSHALSKNFILHNPAFSVSILTIFKCESVRSFG